MNLKTYRTFRQIKNCPFPGDPQKFPNPIDRLNRNSIESLEDSQQRELLGTGVWILERREIQLAKGRWNDREIVY